MLARKRHAHIPFASAGKTAKTMELNPNTFPRFWTDRLRVNVALMYYFNLSVVMQPMTDLYSNRSQTTHNA